MRSRCAPFVKNKRLLWNLHNLAAAYGKRPADYLEIDDTWLAYQVDLACLIVGREIEGRIRRKAPVNWGDKKPATQHTVGSLRARARKLAVPENGVW